jgi:hypothetical protein
MKNIATRDTNSGKKNIARFRMGISAFVGSFILRRERRILQLTYGGT